MDTEQEKRDGLGDVVLVRHASSSRTGTREAAAETVATVVAVIHLVK